MQKAMNSIFLNINAFMVKAAKNLAVQLSLMIAAFFSSPSAWAGYDINILSPATPISHQIYDLHMYILYVCAAIFIIVFSMMFYSIFKFRKSVGAKPDVNFHESTLIEIIWTIIPFIILIAMAIPATKTVLDMKDTSNPDITIKVTGYQWGWRYDYSADDFGFYSNLATPWSQIGQPGIQATEAKGKDYLLEVDNTMVVPVNKRVRLLVTSNDVIHGWYMPQLGVNQYGIPGFIKDVWFKAEKVGVYKGQCSQICGKLHGYMPITVEVKSEADYALWVKSGQTKWGKGAALTASIDNSAPKSAVLTEEPTKNFTMVEAKAHGEKVYATNCIACHQLTGKGQPPVFPALSGSKVVQGPMDQQIGVILSGRPGTAMQSFARLSDTDLAAVITYTKNSWDNNTGKVVQPSDVKEARKT